MRRQQCTGLQLESLVKKELWEKKKNKRKRKVEVIEARPVMGGALQQKLAKLKSKAVAV